MPSAAEAIESFLRSARKPALLEAGEALLPLTSDSFSSEQRTSHVLLQAWDEHRNIVRRVIGVREQTRGKLALTVQKFAGREGELLLLDLAVPAKREWKQRGEKLVFRERFREFLAREFADYELAELSVEANLEQSLSPRFPRALVRRGQHGFAAIAAGPGTDDPSGILTFGLIWLDYLRQRESRLTIEGLVLLLPAGQERQTSLRVRHLANARFEIFTYDERDHAIRMDPADYGNVDTTLDQCRRPLEPNASTQTFESLDAIEGLECVEKPDGSISLRIHGLEFARMPGSKESTAELLVHARELSRMRREPGSLLHAKDPERWLESQVRGKLPAIDASLRPSPIYGQVPAFTGGDRGLIDLLAVEYSGRLTVLELKASADIHLPLQALDYWMRVAKQVESNGFTPKGYFPGVQLSRALPRMLLVAPALEFHPTSERILSYFSSAIEVQRIGLAADWRNQLRVMFRLSGSATA